MEKVFSRFLALVSATTLLSACDILNPPPSYSAGPPNRVVVARQNVPTPPEEMREAQAGGQGRVATVVQGDVGNRMDSIDKSKLSHALDKPLGRTTTWTNANTGVNYTVVPVKKVSVNGNSFCRQYQVIATRGEQRRELSGTACVGADGQWQSV